MIKIIQDKIIFKYNSNLILIGNYLKNKIPQYILTLIFPIIELFLKRNLLLFFKKEKKSILKSIYAFLLTGIEVNYSISQLLDENIKNKRYISLYFLSKIEEHLRTGSSLEEALYYGKLINKKEFEILKNSSNILDSILLMINNEKLTISTIKLFFLLIFPSVLLVFILYIIKATTYLYLLAIPFILLIIIIALYKFIERKKSKKFFKLFPHIEKKFVYEILDDIEMLYDANIPLPKIMNILLKEEKNYIKKAVYSELHTHLINGNYSLTNVLSNYHINTMTLQMINVSEETGDRKLLKSHINSLKLDYEISMINLKKLFLYTGIVLAIIISIKPFLEIF